ncbi:hypothetical protein KUTeg_018077 [Tegillarca granosa]|uniref:Uncharacterized protein n=1 Tax=Tegillarca granosa TaxID=220873 RepID=A0ABQ9EGS8_TEGGR|nr:hypothetical protein KUTeg_018077 [Tegillarca granosa]
MADYVGMAFVPYYNHLIKLLETSKELKQSAKGIFKQMAWAAGGACVGGVVGGPPGALFGTLAGGVIGFCLSDPYKATITVLKEMSEKDKKRLVEEVQKLVGANGIEALTKFIGGQVQREMLLNLIQKFVNDVKGG